MRDENGRSVFAERNESLEERGFCGGVQASRGFVENHDVGFLVGEEPSKRDALPLSERELAPALEPLSELGIVASGQFIDQTGHQRSCLLYTSDAADE